MREEECMHILERLDSYIQEVKRTPYVYSIQKMGINIFRSFIMENELDIREEDFRQELLEQLILIWFPDNNRHLDEQQAYQIIYTINDVYKYIHRHSHTEEIERKQILTEESTILQIYAKEYMRIYKVKRLLQEMTNDPIISVNPTVIDLMKYKNKKTKGPYSDIGKSYEQALFRVQECKEGGQVILNKLNASKQYKLLLDYPVYKYIKKGDLLQAVIKRRFFCIYWELEEIKTYYLAEAIPFLSCL